MRNTLICTVGTSLETNLKNLSETSPDLPKNWQAIKKFFNEKRWSELAKELLKLDPSSRICGAEINTIEEARKRGFELEKLFLLVSDTDAGENIGKLLKKYFESREDLKLKEGDVEFRKIEKLQDSDPKAFKIHGLRNLVREIGEIIQRVGGTDRVVIDATGGYKAQIAVAVLLGQALSIPVYYKHERFSEIIDFPPLPISLDYDLIGSHSDILVDLEQGKAYTSSEIGSFDEKLRVFLTEVEVNGETLYEINPIGQIYLTSFRIRKSKVVNLKALDDSEREKPSFSEHHYPKGFQEFVEKVWKENRWIKTCRSYSYDKQASIRDIAFRVERDKQDEKRHILLGTYRSDFGARFRIFLQDESVENLNYAADELNRKYRT